MRTSNSKCKSRCTAGAAAPVIERNALRAVRPCLSHRRTRSGFWWKAGYPYGSSQKTTCRRSASTKFYPESCAAGCLAAGKGGKIQKSAWRIVGQHIIHFVIAAARFSSQKAYSSSEGISCFHQFTPVSRSSLSWLSAPPKQRYFLSSSSSTLPRHTWYTLPPKPAPCRQSARWVLRQQVVVFVAAVQKQQGIGALAQPVQLFLFLLAAVPHKAEIAQHHHGVPFAQPAQLAVLEAVKSPWVSPVRYTIPASLPDVKSSQKPCHSPPNLLL